MRNLWGVLVGVGVLLNSCAPTSNIGWRKKVARSVKGYGYEEIEVVRVKQYVEPFGLQDYIRAGEGSVATAPYGISPRNSFGNGTNKRYIVSFRRGNKKELLTMRFTNTGAALNKY